MSSMRVIISPAKKMKSDNDLLPVKELPCFVEKAEYLRDCLRKLSYEQAKVLWNCSDSIASLNYERLKAMDLRENLVPALLSYEGIQYQYMAPSVLEDGQWKYVQENVRILSGFYGVVKPLDGVTPYRLEMQAGFKIDGYQNLYEYWGGSVYNEISKGADCILNLASKEYSKCIQKYVSKDVKFITCVFGEIKGDKVVEKGTYAKMARGEMVRYMAGCHANSVEDLKGFRCLDYRYAEQFSDDTVVTFLRRGERE